MGLAAKVLQAAFVALLSRRRPCEHPADQLTPVTGNVCHCTCGEAFRVPCQHTRATALLPKVLQCVDCLKTFGYGEDPK